MLDFLSQYWGSILIAAIVLGLCGLAARHIIVQRKRGCGGDCRGCENCGACHKNIDSN